MQQSLRHAQCPRGATGQLSGQGVGFFLQLGVRYNPGRQPPFTRLLRRQHAVGQGQLQSPFQTHNARQVIRRRAVRRQSGTGVGHRETGRLGRQYDVGAARQAHAGAGRHAIDGRHHRRVHAHEARHRGVEIGRHLFQVIRQVVALRPESLQIATGGKHRAVPRDDDSTNSGVLAALHGRVHEIPGQLGVDGVGGVRPVQRNARHPVTNVKQKRCVRHIYLRVHLILICSQNAGAPPAATCLSIAAPASRRKPAAPPWHPRSPATGHTWRASAPRFPARPFPDRGRPTP